MSRDDITGGSCNDESENYRLDQRITALEEQNEELRKENEHIKSQLEQRQERGLPNVSRRQTLAGLLGGGALLGGMGAVSADPGSGNGDPPFADEAHDHSGDYLGEGTPVARLDVDQMNVTGDESLFEEIIPYRTKGVTQHSQTYRSNDRKIYSTEAQRFFIDPDEGDDDNDGSESAPFRTLQRAAEEMALFQFHQFEIQLARKNPENKYDSAHFPPSILGYDDQWVSGPGSGAMFTILGDRDDPSAYPFERGAKLGIGFGWNVGVPGAWVAGMELGGVNLDGTCTFTDCRFTGWNARNDDTPTCIGGYTGRADFRSCTFTSKATYAFGAANGKILMTRGCTFDTDYVMAGSRWSDNMGSFVFLQDDPGIPMYRNREEAEDNNTYIQVNGPVLNGPGTLYEGADEEEEEEED